MMNKKIWGTLGNHIEEAWRVAEVIEMRLLGVDVTLTVKELLTGHNAGQFLASGSHSVKSDTQAGPYQPCTLTSSADEAVFDWVNGISIFAGNPGAKMVKA